MESVNCDSHFSIISRIMNDYERGHEMIGSTGELITILTDKLTRY
jgi:hypothetical protein